MHRLPRLLAITLLLGALPASAQADGLGAGPLARGFPPAPQVVPGEVVVGFSPHARAATRADARDAVDADVQRKLTGDDLQLLSVPKAADVRDAADELAGEPGVSFAEPNYLGHVAEAPDDPDYLSGLQPALARIDAPHAWDYETGSADLKVAVIDSGVDVDHPDLVDGLAPGADDDVLGHGTHVAGILAARGDNGIGVSGVAWRSRLISLRACGAGGVCGTAQQANAILAAGASGARVANLSIETATGTPPSDAVRSAIASYPDMLVVAAAGNSTTVGVAGRNVDAEPSYPCSYDPDNVICVAATRAASSTDEFYSYSNFGSSSVDLAAPGAGVRSTTMGGGYDVKSGTSMAAPHVAGAAALLWSQHPDASLSSVRGALLSSVDARQSLSGRVATGGRLNASKALAVLDDAAPETAIDAPPATPTESTSATFDFSSSERNSTFECRLDGAGWEGDCASPKTFAGLLPGHHDFEVRASDAHPNTDNTPATQRIDIRPSTVFDEAPTAAEKSSSATLSWRANESGVSFECTFDGAPYADCDGSTELTGLSEGAHTFGVRGKGGAAGDELTAKTRRWTVDLQPPSVSVKPAQVDGRVATVAVASDDPDAKFRCALNGGGAEPCSSPYKSPRLQDDDYELSVIATDAAGNSSAPATTSWAVEAPPDVTLTDSDPVRPDAQVEFDVSDDATAVTCRLDGGDPEPECISPHSFASVADGPHTVTVTATDDGGKSTSASQSWTVDTTPPVVRYEAVPTRLTASPSATIAWTVDDANPARLACVTDAVTQGACASPRTLTELGDGPHSIELTATDAAGNAGVPTPYAWTVDTRPPNLRIVSAPGSVVRTGHADVSFTAESGAAVTCALDGGAATPCASPYVADDLADRGHTLALRATDAVGNDTAATAGWTVDMGPVSSGSPPPATDGPPAAPSAQPTPTPTPTVPDRPASTRSLAKTVAKRLHRLSGRRAARLKPFRLRYRSPLAGTLRVTIDLKRRHRKALRVGGGSTRYKRAGTHRIKVAMRAKGKRALRRVHHPRLRVRVTFRATSGASVSATR